MFVHVECSALGRPKKVSDAPGAGATDMGAGS